MVSGIDERICLITGATGGIGKAAAFEIARQGYVTVIVGRDPARTEATARAIQQDCPGARVETLVADLSSMAEVKRLAEAYKARHDTLHVLVNNAGAYFAERRLTVDGFERNLALNHLAPHLLTRELRELLVASEPARVITTASGAHAMGEIHFDDIQMERSYTALGAYAQSKLANILFTNELALRFAGTGVTANCFHPGAVATGWGTDKGVFSFFVSMGRPFMRSPEKGAETLVYLATSPESEGRTGGYYMDKKPKARAKQALDPSVAHRLWDLSDDLVNDALVRAGS